VMLSGTAEAYSTVVLFEDDASEGTTLTDGTGAWSLTVGGMPDGERVFAATASDAAGNVSDPSESLTVNVDTVAPESSITSGPSGAAADTSGVFSFTGSADAVSFECALDGAAFAPCSSPLTLSSLSPGGHALAVRARDGAGNVDGTPALRTWSVEPPPVVPTPQGVPGPLTGPPATPAFSAAVAPARPTIRGERVRRTTRRRVSVRFVTDAAGTARVTLVRCSPGAGACRRYAVVGRAARPVVAGPVTVGLRTAVLLPGAYQVRVGVRSLSGGDSGLARVTLVVRRGG